MRHTIKLDADSTHRAIENAVRTQAQIVLEISASTDRTINGFLICGDEAALLIETTGQLSMPVDDLLNTPCDVRVYADQRFRFTSTISAAPRWGESRSLAIARPKNICVLERRETLRARLAPSTRVKLEWDDAGVNHRHLAAILNVSPDGLACRIDDSAAAAIQPDAVIRVRFELPGGLNRPQSRLFNLAATVSNKTPASEGCTILGLQFRHTRESEDDLDELGEALTNPATVTIGQGRDREKTTRTLDFGT
jgi:hypothetical protein